MFFEEEEEREVVVETDLDVKERQKSTYRKRREFSKREKSKDDVNDRFDKLKNKKRSTGKKSRGNYEMED